MRNEAWIRRTLSNLTIAFVFAVSMGAHAEEKVCRAVLQDAYQPPALRSMVEKRPDVIQKIEVVDGFVDVNGAAITGDIYYPLHVVMTDLALTQNDVYGLRGKTVLSLGEGFSGLVPMLLQNGTQAYGLDLWYHQVDLPSHRDADLMRQYVQIWGDRLIRGSALDIPLADEAMEMVVSHQLVNNFTEPGTENTDLKQVIGVIREAIRVVAVRGEVRIFGVDVDEPAIRDFLRETYGDRVTFRFEERSARWELNGRTINHSSGLLVVKKNVSTRDVPKLNN